MGARILVVDDNPKNIQVLGNMLYERGYDIEIAMNGGDALELIKEINFDLILLDIMMPEKDGFEVCFEIRQNESNDNIPIIFLTAKTDIESLVKGFDLGGQDFLIKPFNEKELLARTKTHLDLKKHKDKLDELVELRTQQLQKAYEELEVLDIAKAEFLNMLSHEIRTPLNGIFGFLDLIKAQCDSERLQEYLSHLSNSAKRLEEFSFKALVITSLRTNTYKLVLEEINIVELINTSLEHFKETFEEKSIEVITSYPSMNSIIVADAKLISDSLKEVIGNVCVHSVKANQILISVIENEHQTKIEIEDNGNGFSDKAIKAMFKPFSFGEEHVNNKAGLGLHLVKLVMDAHKFNVIADNNSSGGAFVHFIFNK